MLNILSSRKAFLRSLSFVCCTCLLLFGLPEAKAQIVEEEIKPLQIGDTIPEALWDMPLQVVNHPEGKETITLNNYRDKKLVILDFWSSWCGPCVRSLPAINNFYDEPKEDFSMLLVTRDSPERIAEFERRIQDVYEQKLPYITNQELEAYFPFRSLPQNVWINSEGLVVCIAMGDIITPQNVEILK